MKSLNLTRHIIYTAIILTKIITYHVQIWN